MKIEELRDPSPEVLDELLAVWEQSVRSSHGFLSEEDIDFFKPLIRNEYFRAVRLFVIRGADGHIAAFMGLSDEMIEMLFVRPDEQGRGHGKALVSLAINKYHIYKVDVNEQNPQALGFYLRMGYQITGRDALDPTGKPFPILHMSLIPPPHPAP